MNYRKLYRISKICRTYIGPTIHVEHVLYMMIKRTVRVNFVTLFVTVLSVVTM